MPLFRYTFGFESPRQSRNNARRGWDDEDSQILLIEADDDLAALAWGQTVSERFVKLLYRDESESWRGRFAYWVERVEEPSLEGRPVRVGEFPDFAPWLRPYEGEV